jgi:regulator of sirC expression with transglutaminase-like and TPR domain
MCPAESSGSWRELLRLLQRPTENPTVDRAMLLFAADVTVGMDPEVYLLRLDHMAAQLERRLCGSRDPLAIIATMRSYLYVDLGFRPVDFPLSASEYLLNSVIDQRQGHRLALGALLIALGRRIGFDLTCVGLPGYFILKHRTPAGELLIDPGDGGLLSVEQCRRIFEEKMGEHGSVRFQPELLAEMTTTEMLLKVLDDLKHLYFHQGHHDKALSMLDRVLGLDPSQVGQYRCRAVLNFQLGRYPEALEDLRTYLRDNPEGQEEAQEARDQAVVLHGMLAQLN